MKVHLSKLPNRMQVIAIPVESRKSVAVGIWVHAGSRHEEGKQSGISHFLEHLVFKGTASRTSDQIKQSIEGVGGSMNAFTSEDHTCFFAKVASRHLNGVFDVLTDMVLNASLKKDDIEKERGVILEEIKMTLDQPSQYVEEVLSEILWEGHPLARPIAGTEETVKGISREDLIRYRDRYYQPGFLTVAAAGDINSTKLKALAGAAFTLTGEAPRRPHFPFKRGSSKTTGRFISKKTEQTHLALAVHAFPKSHPDEYVLDLLNVILGGNMSSRLFNEVREQRSLAYEIGSAPRKFPDAGAWVVTAGVDPGKAQVALEVILQVLSRVAREGVSQDELKRSKEYYLGQLELGLESSTNQMMWVGESYVTAGTFLSPEEVTRLIEKVSLADIRRVAKVLFRNDQLHCAAIGPCLQEKTLLRALSFR